MMQQRLKRQTPALLLANTHTVLGRTTLVQTGTACRSSTFQQTESNRRQQIVMLLRGADVFSFAEGDARLAESHFSQLDAFV